MTVVTRLFDLNIYLSRIQITNKDQEPVHIP